MLRTICGSLIVVVVVGVLLGCQRTGGPATEKVSGKVTFKGQPVAGAIVTFAPKSPGAKAAAGTTDASGRFRLTTSGAGDGAVAGSYAVTVIKPERPKGPPAESGAIPPEAQEAVKKAQEEAKKTQEEGKKAGDEGSKESLPEKYKSAETSGLTAEVKARQSNDFTFDLKE